MKGKRFFLQIISVQQKNNRLIMASVVAENLNLCMTSSSSLLFFKEAFFFVNKIHKSLFLSLNLTELSKIYLYRAKTSFTELLTFFTLLFQYFVTDKDTQKNVFYDSFARFLLSHNF